MCLFAGAAHSALVDVGDFTTDTASGLDWLKVNKVSGLSYAQVASGALGYTSAGWRFATSQEMVNLFQVNIGPSNNLYGNGFNGLNASASGYFAKAEDLVLKLGMNFAFSDDRAVYNSAAYSNLHQISVQGFFNGGSGFVGLAEATAVFTGEFYGQDAPYGRWLSLPSWGGLITSSRGPNLSSFLVRNSAEAVDIPEPSGIALLGLGLFGLALAGRKRTAK